MGLFDDVGRFLEDRLEEFLQNNPHLELEALLEQLKEQEADARRLLTDLQRKKQDQEAQILNLAQDIQAWHSRIQQAKAAGREDLAQRARKGKLPYCVRAIRCGDKGWGQNNGLAKPKVCSRKFSNGKRKYNKRLNKWPPSKKHPRPKEGRRTPWAGIKAVPGKPIAGS